MEVFPLSDCPVVPSWVQKVYATGRSIGAWATPLPRSCIQMPDTERQDLAVWKVAKTQRNLTELDSAGHQEGLILELTLADAHHRLRRITWPFISCRSVAVSSQGGFESYWVSSVWEPASEICSLCLVEHMNGIDEVELCWKFACIFWSKWGRFVPESSCEGFFPKNCC